jgi:hypothetical protein
VELQSAASAFSRLAFVTSIVEGNFILVERAEILKVHSEIGHKLTGNGSFQAAVTETAQLLFQSYCTSGGYERRR